MRESKKCSEEFRKSGKVPQKERVKSWGQTTFAILKVNNYRITSASPLF